MSIRQIAQLALNPANDPRDARIHERIQEEMVPVAEDIWREYRAGYTEEEILERARQRRETMENRRQATRQAQRQRAEKAEEVRQELGKPDPEVKERLRELTREGPVLWTDVAPLLRKELGVGWQEARKVAGDDEFSVQRDGGRAYIQSDA